MKQLPPVLTALLVAMWLLLNDTLAPIDIALGSVLAMAVVLVFQHVRPPSPRLRHGLRAIRLVFVVLFDILRSNIGVGRIILGLTRRRQVRSGFLDIPLALRDPHGLAVLAMIVTSTPGTVWVALSPDGGTLTLHILDLRDEAAWVRTIKHRYERPLMEIFE